MAYVSQPSRSAPTAGTIPFISQSRQWRLRRCNPHSASRTVSVLIPRFPPLAVCVRRPLVRAAPSSWPASANVHMNGPGGGSALTSALPLISEVAERDQLLRFSADLAISRPIVVSACMPGSSESLPPQQQPRPWHLRAGGGAVHSIKCRLMRCSKCPSMWARD
jgi:hypothetical protein